MVVGEVRIVDGFSHLDRGTSVSDSFASSVGRVVDLDVDLADLDIHGRVDCTTRPLKQRSLHAIDALKCAT